MSAKLAGWSVTAKFYREWFEVIALATGQSGRPMAHSELVEWFISTRQPLDERPVEPDDPDRVLAVQKAFQDTGRELCRWKLLEITARPARISGLFGPMEGDLQISLAQKGEKLAAMRPAKRQSAFWWRVGLRRSVSLIKRFRWVFPAMAAAVTAGRLVVDWNANWAMISALLVLLLAACAAAMSNDVANY